MKPNNKKIIPSILGLIIILMIFNTASFASPADLHESKQYQLYKDLVSQSYVIASGTLISDTSAILKSHEDGIFSSFKLTVLSDSILKGDILNSQVIEINFNTRPIHLRPKIDTILKYDLTEVVVFLKKVTFEETSEYYFIASDQSIIQSSTQALKTINSIIKKQSDYIMGFDDTFKITDDKLNSIILDLIQKLRNDNTKDKAFKDLIELGSKAVPYIIVHMNDFTKLPDTQFKIKMTNGYNKTFTPDLVVDALAIVLNAITDKHYGFIYNGATDDERKHAISAWRTYLMD